MPTDSKAEQLVSEFLDEHDDWTSDEFQEHAEGYARRAELEHPINRAPSTIAAAAIYLAGLLVNEKVTQREVSAASDVSEHAISQCYQELTDCEGLSTGDEVNASKRMSEVLRSRIRRAIGR